MSAAMKEAFCLFDRDADGLIHAREIPMVILSLGVNLSEAQLSQMLEGREESLLTYDDFVKIAGAKCLSTDPEAELNKAFKRFDRDNNGTVSTGELKQVLLNLGEKLSEKDVSELIMTADPAQSGTINYKEFSALLCNKV